MAGLPTRYLSRPDFISRSTPNGNWSPHCAAMQIPHRREERLAIALLSPLARAAILYYKLAYYISGLQNVQSIPAVRVRAQRRRASPAHLLRPARARSQYDPRAVVGARPSPALRGR